MATNNDFYSRLAKLQEFQKSEDFSNIINTLKNRDFDSEANGIVEKWISPNETLSNDDTKYLDSYSNVQLSLVKYCFFNSNTAADVQPIIDQFRVRLFKKTQTDTLAEVVEFIREPQSNSNNEDDLMLVYIMRMIDARSLAYRLYFNELRESSPKNLNDALKDCLLHRYAKDILNTIKSANETNENISVDNRHKFFLGCSTFAVALYQNNKEMLKDDKHNNKYICLLAKYVRIMLSKKDFTKNESILYCLRGILALLTNCVPFEYWLNIMNEALANEDDDNAQKKNPFNLDLFSLIVNQLLASTTLQKKTEQSASNDETLLLDTALVFLVKWSNTQRDLNEDDEEETNNNNSSSPFDKPNQLLHCFRSHEQFQRTARIIVPYIDAKYDRLRLMALSILSNIMNNQDFKQLETQKPHMAKDLVKLIFDFTDQAVKQPDSTYKGISFDMLLSYLLRFLVQDFVKKETLPYVSQIVTYARNQYLYALKILRKISTNPGLQKDLQEDVNLKQFLEKDADIIYRTNEKMNKIIQHIRENLAPTPPRPPTPPKQPKSLPSVDDNTCQVFISYRHADDDMCQAIEQKLREVKLVTNIWIDKYYMTDNLYETVAKAVKNSKVVFVLLSDKYCESNFCRREWEYAIAEEIKVYVIFVQKDFDKENCDWVKLIMGTNLYYKMHKADDVEKLFRDLREFLHQKLEHKSKINNETRPPSPPPPRPKIPIEEREYSKKPSIATWTCEDIRDWCTDNDLEKWRALLTNFDGQNLLVLRQDLSNDSHIQYIVKGNNINGFDIARFKSEIDKLLSKPQTTNKPPTTKPITKRRISKSSNK